MVMDKLEQWTSDPHHGELLFFWGFGIYLFRYIMVTTMFPFSGKLSVACIGLFVLFSLAKIVLFDTYTLRMFLLTAGLFICGLLIALFSGYIHPFLWLLAVVAARDVPFRKILQIYLLLNLTILGLAFFASMIGVIENLVYMVADQKRNSFGCVYTTDFAAHIFYLLLTAFYLWQERLRWYHYVGACLAAGGIYYFCMAKLDTICILLMVILFGGYHVLQWQAREEQTLWPGDIREEEYLFKRGRAFLRWKKMWKVAAEFSMPFLALFMILLTWFFSLENEFLIKIDEIITSRLQMGKVGLSKYGLSLFGQDVPMKGNGGNETIPGDYFFVDCSYLFILLRYGLVFLLLLFLIYGAICYRRREDTALFLAILLLAVCSAIDHHLLEAAYNPFGFALFAGGLLDRRPLQQQAWNNMENYCEKSFLVLDYKR